MREESEDIEPVIDGNGHDTFGGKALPVVARLRTIAGDEATAVNINQHGQPRVVGFRRSPDVEVKTILAHAVRAEVHVAEHRALGTTRSELIRLTDASPVFRKLWFLPAQIA